MDELSQAFESPAVRAAATQGNDICDRISVRDYVREVEIGAFRAERGTTQRIRFNVVLEVSAHVAARDDDVDKVLSYDTITQAIEAELAAARINLLETLAERIAARVLRDRRALRIFVRIEKLDRIPGALGVEIARVRLNDDTAVLPVVSEVKVEAAPAPDILYLANAITHDGPIHGWLAVLQEHRVTVLLAPMPDFSVDVEGEAARQMMLLSMDQNAVRLAALHQSVAVVDNLTELDWALEEGLIPAVAPHRIVAAAANQPEWDIDAPEALAHWLATQLNAGRVTLAGATKPGFSFGADAAEAYGATHL